MKLISTLLFFLVAICMAISQNFNIYVSDAGNFDQPPWQVLKFDQNGENGLVFINEQLAWPQDILFLEEDKVVLITNLNTGKITRYNSETGAYLNDFATGLGGPTRMKVGQDGLLYVLQWQGNGKVKRYKLDGSFVDDFTSIGVGTSIGLAWDQENNLYVSSYNGKFVQRFDAEGNDMGKFISTNLVGPTNIWFSENGDLIVIDYNAGKVKRFDSDGNFIGIMIADIQFGEGIDFLSDGRMLIGSGGNASIGLYEKNGTLIENIISSGSTGLKTPNAVRVRLTNTTSTKEKSIETEFVSPTVGSYFSFKQEEPGPTITSYEIFDSMSRLILKIDAKDQAYWKANLVPNGVYIVKGILSNGKTISQKIIVKK